MIFANFIYYRPTYYTACHREIKTAADLTHLWNSLTPQIRQCQILATFRRHLKTHYFQSAFSAT